MNTLRIGLYHDPACLPQTLFDALVEAGHRVAAHGADVDGVREFLDAMRWTPDVFILDFTGHDDDEVLRVLEWLAAHPRWGEVPQLLIAVPDALAERVARVVPRDGWARGVDEVIRALA